MGKAREMTRPLPALLPPEKPTDRPFSAAMHRLYDVWNPLEDRGNPLFSNFRYTPLQGFPQAGNVSRRDPSKVLRIKGTYYVWYTRRLTEMPPAGAELATDAVPSVDWDLSEIWYATSADGFTWDEQGPAVRRPPKPGYGWRSVATPDILVWQGRYYLYYQGFNEIPGLQGDRAATTVAEADSPTGPWRPLGDVVVDFGKEGEWDSGAIHDPYPLVYKGKIHLYYKGSPGKNGRDGTLVRAQGVAIADSPLGPFTKHPLNPVLNSGHETCLFPYKEGIAAIVSLDGPEKNTLQYAPDGISFDPMAHLQVCPLAPGPFVPDAFADNGDGRGITWGLSHITSDGEPTIYSVLTRFDCDFHRDVDRPMFKHNNLRFNEATYFQKRVGLPDWLRTRVSSPDYSDPFEDGEAGEKVEAAAGKPFPGVMPSKRPERPMSKAWARMYDVWGPHEDRTNELYSNFRYSRLQGLTREANVSRRDPSKIIKVGDTYYVWYTCRRSVCAPVGQAKATAEHPATDWDLADIWYATSLDGRTWQEQGLAVKRPSKPATGWRSICTPDILVWEGKYYLYFQAYSEVCSGNAYCPVRVAWAERPDGPWTLADGNAVEPGPAGSWNNIKINDPYPIVFNGKIYLYYKGAPLEKGPEYILRMQGVATSDDPLGPFVHSPLNPVLNSGHETCIWPWQDGVAALVSLDGPEKNTVQFAADGENFEPKSLIQVPPVAPGPFVPDAFADDGDGRGFTWGLCHVNPDGGGATNESILARFDCDLSLDVDRQVFKRNNLRFDEETYLQRSLRLPDGMRKLIERERETVDRDTIGTDGP
ncbi:MAG: family 43 glycosylhydrolase [Victivallales bacterium]|nr:family 43 glycosylhydrolase [Victivallales bacterium]